MPSPQLRTGMPNTMNALQTLHRERRQDERPANVLAQKRLEDYDADRSYLEEKRGRERTKFEDSQADRTEDRADKKEDRNLRHRMGALSIALQADTPDQAKKLYNLANPDDDDVDLSFVGDGKQVQLAYPNGWVLKGPKAMIKELAEQVSQDPTWLTDPEKAQKTMAWAAAKGITMTAPQKEKTKPPKQGETRSFQRGDQTVTEEWTGKEWNALGSGPKFRPEKSKTKIHKIGDIRTFQKGRNKVTEEYTEAGWTEKATGPMDNTVDTSSKETKKTYSKMKRIEKILGEVDHDISLFTQMENPTEDQKQTVLASIEKMALDADQSARHRQLANEYLVLVDKLYDSKKPASTNESDPLRIR